MTSSRLATSRPDSLARTVSSSPETLRERMSRFVVGISVEPDVLGIDMSLRVLVGSLWRMSANVAIIGNVPEATRRVLDDLTHSIDPERELVFGGVAAETDMQIHLGRSADDGVVKLIPDNHGVRLSRRRSTTLDQLREPSALGSVVTAAVAAAEAYKVLVDADPKRCRLIQEMSFCPVTLTDRPELAPPVRPGLKIDAALIGLGAIGTCHVLILGNLGIGGRLILCDRQAFAVENVGTYSYGSLEDAALERRKVDMAIERLADFQTEPADEDLEALIDQLRSGELDWPTVVLTGLDSAEARYDVQRIYPPRMVDAATGDTLVSLHDSVHGQACLRCLLPPNTSSTTAPEQLADLLGLSIEVVGDGDHVLTAEEVETARPEHREKLRAMVGKPVCSIPSVEDLTSLDNEGFDPAAPFVAQFAACLSVGRLLAVALDVPIDENFVQIDTMFGPEQDFISRDFRAQNPACQCVERSATINQLHERRYGGAGSN